MKFIIDDADIAKIKDIYNTFAVDGVTTNPSILAKSGRQPYEVLTEIREFIGPDAELHVQVIALDAEGMVRDGHRIVEVLGKNTYVKVPTTKEGLRAMKLLHGEGIRVTATAIYTRMQAFLAAKAGADYAAPYVNRIDNLGGDGVKTAQDIHDIFRKNGLNCQVLAASFKNSQQVQELCEYGIGAATISPDVIEALIKNDSVTMAVEAFVKDFEGLCGKGVTMETSK
ncbi:MULTISPECIES: transaldolase family protein [Enterocloster]|uniref:Fructose-6-phosphate aldolase, TalC/MipB family n=1 Tax=Enterocloster lavalensis TaxID=460384 RepID=A0A1I0J872_9FIRM|nr:MULTISPECIES: transaldolase family protein [Enterocloster]MDR3756026.1 transaldolase family protein [Enterocloster sp.]PST30172.1 fructose-6-phosphate aldolase [Enterocloster lavalensis]SEU06015.1 fructose-6-phosphate aldolase, TalC/MipB family [Enterocloster lavalensis]